MLYMMGCASIPVEPAKDSTPAAVQSFSAPSVKPSATVHPAFEDVGPGQYDLMGRMTCWYESAGVRREPGFLDREEYSYVYDGRTQEERKFLDLFKIVRFSNGDLLALVWAHQEGYINYDESVIQDIAKTMANKEHKKYAIQGDDHLGRVGDAIRVQCASR